MTDDTSDEQVRQMADDVLRLALRLAVRHVTELVEAGADTWGDATLTRARARKRALRAEARARGFRRADFGYLGTFTDDELDERDE